MQYFNFRQLGPTPDGDERMLGFDMNAIADLEIALGNVDIYTLLREHAGFNFMRHLLWAALKWQDPMLTPASVGELIQKHVIDNGKNLDSIVDPTMAALRDSKVIIQTKKKDRPTAQAGRKGKTPPAKEPKEEKA